MLGSEPSALPLGDSPELRITVSQNLHGMPIQPLHHKTSQLVPIIYGWGGRDRTYECWDQNPVPYHLATPQNYELPSRKILHGMPIQSLHHKTTHIDRNTCKCHSCCRLCNKLGEYTCTRTGHCYHRSTVELFEPF